MKNNLLEHIILYVIIASVALVIATLARMSATAMGFDSFTAFMVFIITLAIQVVVYLSIHALLQGLILPWIGKWLAKIPYLRNDVEEEQVSEVVEHEEVVEQEDANDVPEPVSLEAIRDKQQKNKAKEYEEKVNIALNHTRESFVLYISDEHLEVLCQNVQVYINVLGLENLQPVKIKGLTALDLRHFGWNIWNFFKPRSQMDIAYFLKVVFPDIFKDAEVESIKRHLKDDELKGVIKIVEDIK